MVSAAGGTIGLGDEATRAATLVAAGEAAAGLAASAGFADSVGLVGADVGDDGADGPGWFTRYNGTATTPTAPTANMSSRRRLIQGPDLRARSSGSESVGEGLVSIDIRESWGGL